MKNNKPLNIFLCHASGDKDDVKKLYLFLQEHGHEPWLDNENLLAGQNWEIEIEKAVEKADIVLVCLSNDATDKEGYVQKEIKYALDIADKKPDETVYIIPAKLQDCKLPRRLNHLQSVDIFNEKGKENLVKSLNSKCESEPKLKNKTTSETNQIDTTEEIEKLKKDIEELKENSGGIVFKTNEW